MTRFFVRTGARAGDGRVLLPADGVDADDASTLIFLRSPLIGTSSSLSLAAAAAFTFARPFASLLTAAAAGVSLLTTAGSFLTATGSLLTVAGSLLTVMSMPARASARSLESGTSSSLSLLLLLVQ